MIHKQSFEEYYGDSTFTWIHQAYNYDKKLRDLIDEYGFLKKSKNSTLSKDDHKVLCSRYSRIKGYIWVDFFHAYIAKSLSTTFHTIWNYKKKKRIIKRFA